MAGTFERADNRRPSSPKMTGFRFPQRLTFACADGIGCGLSIAVLRLGELFACDLGALAEIAGRFGAGPAGKGFFRNLAL